MTREEFIEKWGHGHWSETVKAFVPSESFLSDLDSVIKSSLPPAEGAEEETEKVKCINCKMDFPIMQTYFNWDTGARRCWTCQVSYLEHIILTADKIAEERIREDRNND